MALPSEWLLAGLSLLIAVVVFLCARRFLATGDQKNVSVSPTELATSDRDVLTVFYASQKGHARRYADKLVAHMCKNGNGAVAVDLSGFDQDQLVEIPRAVFIVATYAGGSAVPGTEPFFDELAEMSRDFRVEKTLLAGMSYAVFGCGNSEYPPRDFNACARRLDRLV